MNVDDLNQRAARIKSDLSESMQALLKAKDEFKLSPPDKTFTTTLDNLGRADYDVVVCGEVKQGKTSFINALLGQDLLPTDVKVATSQVFRISKADSESFALVFDDGLREPIKRAELVKYGTETDEKLANDPLMRGRKLKWIEVNTPATFLPAGVHLLDTPGLGALYHAHALITHTYVAAADAVIFIKSGDSPLVDTERSFLQKVFNVTTNVMFVQTKTDMLDEEARDALLKRNEELVNREFEKAAHRHITFWPVSSKNLLSAAQADDPAARDMLKEVSGFDAMLDGLTALFFRTTGYVGACAACQESFQYYQRTVAFVAEQQKMLGTADAAERGKLQQAKAEKLRNFTAAWAPGTGAEIRKVNAEIGEILSGFRSSVQGIFMAGGPLRERFSDEIEALPDDTDQIAKYAKSLTDEIVGAVSEEWEGLGTETERDLCRLFERFRHSLVLGGQSDLTEGGHAALKLKDASSFVVLRNTFGGFSMGFGAVAIGAAILGVATGGITIVAAAIAGLFGAGKGFADARQSQAQAHKRTLQNHAVSVFNKLHASLFGSGKDSKVEKFVSSVKRKVSELCESIIENEKERFEDECRQLEEQSKLHVEEARKKLMKLGELGKRLEPVKTKLLSVRDGLVALNSELKF